MVALHAPSSRLPLPAAALLLIITTLRRQRSVGMHAVVCRKVVHTATAEITCVARVQSMVVVGDCIHKSRTYALITALLLL